MSADFSHLSGNDDGLEGTMSDSVLGEIMGSGTEEEAVGALMRWRSRRAGRLSLPTRPNWRTPELPGGVVGPYVGMQLLPFGTKTFTDSIRNQNFEARPQKPFRGQRLLATVNRSVGSVGITVSANTLAIGTDNDLVALRTFSLDFFLPTSFGVGMQMRPAQAGIDVSIPCTAEGTFATPATDSVTVSLAIIGNVVTLPVRIGLTVPEDLPDAAKKAAMEAALESAVQVNLALAKAGRLPSLERAIANGLRWKPEPPGPERFDIAPTAAARKWGDCDDLAAWHAAELRAKGHDARAVVRRSGIKTWHAVVDNGGRIIDPSKAAGMPTREGVHGIEVGMNPKDGPHGCYLSAKRLTDGRMLYVFTCPMLRTGGQLVTGAEDERALFAPARLSGFLPVAAAALAPKALAAAKSILPAAQSILPGGAGAGPPANAPGSGGAGSGVHVISTGQPAAGPVIVKF